MSQNQERSDERAPAETPLPVVSPTPNPCPKAARNGCSACAKCGRTPAPQDKAGTTSTAHDGK